MSDRLVAMREYYDAVSKLFIKSGLTDEDVCWHAYFCGHVRACNEMLEYGVDGVHYSLWTDSDIERHQWFNDGFKNAVRVAQDGVF